MNIHAHYGSTIRDCDGTYEHAYIVRPTAAEVADEQHGEFDFRNRVILMVVNDRPDADSALRVRPLEGDLVRLEWSEPTEEGFVHREITLCTDECEDSAPHYRDHTAESMGY